ncbi:carboxymuconolactone decarboxylase family protein [Actinospica sp. MGRD01-02]|uniref:Carboxymuconolactone decarboxylase family protein n=1 Tax=Actinospica acidithermotolerans TaxID=2828514 RepID=A0A941IEP2_9ACTN|nr:carboxymuconolactone decarboxylase family protein [Actinospica acidithermotolerans]MBR7825450.1 carboxymuconolactone decarboxylase family protein [Actinospica acidithermotolerans]
MTTNTNTNTAAYVAAPAVRIAADKLAPAAMRAMSALDKATASSGLEAGLKELVRARASQINGCAYCVETHTNDALAGGEGRRRLFLLPVWQETGLFTARERAALALTEAVTRLSDGPVADGVWAAAAAEFDDTELADLVWLITTINAWNRVNVAAHVWPVD